jgi:hypothetical protein
MQYFQTTEATDFRPFDWRAKLIKSVLWFIPHANPDFERRYPEVRMWYVEVNEKGAPQRELGVSASGEPIVAGPWGRNIGFWTDSGDARVVNTCHIYIRNFFREQRRNY